MTDKKLKGPLLLEVEPHYLFVPKGLSEDEEKVVLKGHKVISELNKKVIKRIGQQADFRPFYIQLLKDFEKEFSNLSLNNDSRRRAFKRIENIINDASKSTADEALEDYLYYLRGGKFNYTL